MRKVLLLLATPIFILLIIIAALMMFGCRKPKNKPELSFSVDARMRVKETPIWTQTIAVVDTKVTSNTKELPKDIDFGTSLTEKVEAAFSNTGRFDLVERARLHAASSEIDLNQSLAFDPTTANKFGKFLGAKYLLLPTARIDVGVVGTQVELQVKVLDTETGSIVKSFSARATSGSWSVNGSISTCMRNIQNELEEVVAPHYPIRGVIVRVNKDKTLWVETKATMKIRPGIKMRILKRDVVFNIVKNSYSDFLVRSGEAKVMSVESEGLVAKLLSIEGKVEEGDVLEVIR